MDRHQDPAFLSETIHSGFRDDLKRPYLISRRDAYEALRATGHGRRLAARMAFDAPARTDGAHHPQIRAVHEAWYRGNMQEYWDLLGRKTPLPRSLLHSVQTAA